jgi:hypothetical protein
MLARVRDHSNSQEQTLLSSWLFLQVARCTGSRETSGNRGAVVYALRESLIGDSQGYVKYNLTTL